jgi:hypothetical protein
MSGQVGQEGNMSGQRCGIILSVIGIVLVIIGVLWLTVIFPSLVKIPTDYARTFYFEGNLSSPNPVTQAMDTLPVEQTLSQEAVGTKDGAVLIHEVRTLRNAVTKEPLPASYNDESTLTIDRKTLMFVKAQDERERYGYWAPPRGLGEGDSFDIWNPAANRPLTARYMKSEEFQGLQVVVFRISESDISLGTHPQTQLPLSLSTTIELWIEPQSGTVVDQNATTTISMDMMGNKVPLLISSLRWTDDTISEMVGVAKDAKGKLLLFESVIPWLLVGIGAVLVIVGVIFIVRKLATPA